ncbi:MAG: 4Fe-4S binding protein [Ahniella sp.]|nr:4Fe-4S binding protein [Ahniella sp.]
MSEWIGGAALWMVLSILLLVLVLLPWFPALMPRSPAAVVTPAQCSGCRLCVADCPYEAIHLAPHPNLKPGRQIAVVDPDRCAACGICVGACPTASPLFPAAQLISGIDLPDMPIDTFRRRLVAGLSAPNAPRRVLFACAQAARTFDDDRLLVMPFACAAQMPPTFVDLALRLGATEVWINSCSAGACTYRLGGDWVADRLARKRSPRLRRQVPASAWRLTQHDIGAENELFDTWASRPQTTELHQ